MARKSTSTAATTGAAVPTSSAAPSRRPRRAITNTSDTPARRETRPADGSKLATTYGSDAAGTAASDTQGKTGDQAGIVIEAQGTEPKYRPNFRRPAALKYAQARRIVRDFVAGTSAVHANAKEYVPQWPEEDPALYEQRKCFVTVYGATERAKIASLGLVTGNRPPALDKDADPLLVEHAKNIDGKGNDLGAFGRQVLDRLLGEGLAGILVDFSTNPMRTTSDAGQQKAERRPFWRAYTGEQVMNWREGVVGAETKLTLLVLKDETEDEDGDYGVKCVTRYREFRLVFFADPAIMQAAGVVVENGVVTRPGVLFRVWREEKDEHTASLPEAVAAAQASPTTGGAAGALAALAQLADAGKRWVLERDGWFYAADGKAYGEIPFAPCYAQVADETLVCKPPFEALARRNWDFHRVENDRRWCMTLTHAPMAELRGRKSLPNGQMPRFVVRPAGYYDFSDASNSGLNWKTVPSDALVQSEKELERIKAEMATLSLVFMLLTPNGAETATARKLTAQSGFASLALTAQGLKDGMTEATRLHAKYLRDVKPVPVHVTTQFDSEGMSPELGRLLLDMMKESKLTRLTGLQEMQRGGIISEEVDVADEDLTLEAVEEELRQYAMELTAMQGGASEEEDPQDAQSKSPQEKPQANEKQPQKETAAKAA